MLTTAKSAQSSAGEKSKYKCISADSHLDLNWLPADLFVANASNAMKDRMPYVTESPDGPLWVSKNGAKFGLACGVGSSGRKYIPGWIQRADKMAAEGLYSEASKSTRRVTDPHQRVRDQDRDGVQAEILYGILVAAQHLKDPEATNEVCRIYNDWLSDFCKTYPDRLLGLAVMPGTDVEAAIKEFKRVSQFGLKGVELSVTTDMASLVDPMWEPLWRTLSENQLPIHFHGIGSGKQWGQPAAHWSKRDLAASNCVRVSTSQLGAAPVLCSMILGGMLERYPDLKVVLGESGIGWIPYILDRMDYEWEDQFRNDLDLKMKPSDYWKRQCKATFQYDEIGVNLIKYLGEETLMWASDFPHPDGVWPDLQDYITKMFGHVPQQLKQKIICDNAVAFYGLK